VEGVPIRSRQYGWKLLYYSKQNFRNHLPQELDLLARWGLASIGWDFGALDVLKSNGRYVLVEVNSCPSLRDEATCSAYAEAFKEIMDGEE
jgi:glutathione synthase/RimK-type ligase-like ATP-grasp enzyme